MNRKDIANERLGNEIISFIESSDIEETRNLQRRGYNEINQVEPSLGIITFRPCPNNKAV